MVRNDFPGGDVALRTRQIAKAISAARAELAAAELNAPDLRAAGR